MAKDFIHVYVKRTGAAAVRNLPGVTRLLEQQAKKIVAATGKDGYAVTVKNGKTRARARVSTKTYAARREEHQNNTLLKALKQAGGKTIKR